MRASRVLAFIATITVATTTSGPASAAHVAGWTSRITLSVTGGNPDAIINHGAVISGDGRYVAFVSAASNLVPGDTNGVYDVFVRDTRTGTTSRVSVTNAGEQIRDASGQPSISADGRYVAFHSSGSNIDPDHTGSNSDVYIRDRIAGTTRLAAWPSSHYGVTSSPSINADGQYLVVATNRRLAPADTNWRTDIYLWARATDTMELVTSSSTGGASDGDSSYPDVSDDGRYVSFSSTATNLVAAPGGHPEATYVHDRQTGITSRVSVASDGTPGNDASSRARISGDGRYVVFESSADNLVPPDVNGAKDAFLHDRVTGTTEMVSIDANGQQFVYGYEPTIGRDGRYVVFSALGPGRIFRLDRTTGALIQVDVSTAGVPSNDGSYYGMINADGRRILFYSWAKNLAPGVTPIESQLYLRSYRI